MIAQVSQQAGQNLHSFSQQITIPSQRIPKECNILADMVVAGTYLYRHSVSLETHPVDLRGVRIIQSREAVALLPNVVDCRSGLPGR